MIKIKWDTIYIPSPLASKGVKTLILEEYFDVCPLYPFKFVLTYKMTGTFINVITR